MTLSLVALLGDQELGLCFRLDAFGDDAQSERMAPRDGGAAYGARFMIVADLLDKGAVDENAIER